MGEKEGGGFKPQTSNTWLRTCMHMNGVMECGWCFYKFLFQVLMLYYWKSWTICSLNLSAKSFYELVVCRLSKAFSFTILGENVKIVKPTIGAFALFFPMLCITSLVHLEYKKKNRGDGVGKEKQYLYSIALELLSMGSLKQHWWWLFMQNMEKNGGWTIEVVRGLHGVGLWKKY